jgi:hypothetical protein
MNVKDLEIRDRYSLHIHNTTAFPGPYISITNTSNTYKTKLNIDSFLKGTKTRTSDRSIIKTTSSISK